jgi:hypothetical protein
MDSIYLNWRFALHYLSSSASYCWLRAQASSQVSDGDRVHQDRTKHTKVAECTIKPG